MDATSVLLSVLYYLCLAYTVLKLHTCPHIGGHLALKFTGIHLCLLDVFLRFFRGDDSLFGFSAIITNGDNFHDFLFAFFIHQGP